MPETQTEETTLQNTQEAPQAGAQPTLSFTEQPSADILALLQKIQADTAAQAADSKKRLLLARVSTAALVVLVAAIIAAVVMLMPQVNGIIAQAEAVLSDVKIITQQIVDADILAMTQNINQLVSESKTGVTQALTEIQGALKKLQSIDIAGLNKAITDLSNIVSPMARLFGG